MKKHVTLRQAAEAYRRRIRIWLSRLDDAVLYKDGANSLDHWGHISDEEWHAEVVRLREGEPS